MEKTSLPCITGCGPIQMGYGPDLSLFPHLESDRWKVVFGTISRSTHNLFNEGVIAAQKISQETNGPVDVYYSGGIDGEFALHCFMSAGVSFRVVSIEFENSLNDHDLIYAHRFKSKYPKLNYVDYKIDIRNFLDSKESENLAEFSLCSVPHLLVLMKFAAESSNALVLATGEPYIKKTHEGWFLRERESIASLYRFFKRHDIKGTHAFFQHTNELFYSYLADPVIKSLADNQFIGKESSMSSRNRLYSQYAMCEERTKFHGYEKIENIVGEIQTKLEKKYTRHNQVAYFEYLDLLKKLGGSFG